MTSSFLRYTFRRRNAIMDFFTGFFTVFASYPRMLLEVFIRKDFGERYFRMITAVTIVCILAVLPMARSIAGRFLGRQDDNFWLHYGTWYAFLAAFLFMAYRRWQEIRHSPSAFDEPKFSLSSGVIHPKFYSMKFSGKNFTARQIETFAEPALFFAIGVVLWILQQKLGILLAVSSIFYAMSYVAVYRAGDNFVLDKLDEIFANKVMEETFVGGADEDETSTFRYRGSRPKDEERRREILPLMRGETEIVEAL